MSVRILKDVEEAIAREVRRITFHDPITVDKTILEETFDPFTGELVKIEVDPSFYDSSADANNIVYPHFFIRLLRSREDRFSGREVGISNRDCPSVVTTSPGAFEIITSGSDGLVNSIGSDFETNLFQIRKVQAGQLLRLINGNNVGTYIVDSVTINASSPHVITVSNTLVSTTPNLLFDSGSRTVVFQSPVDLNTIEVGDTFTDNSAVSFSITSIDINNNTIVIDGVATPDGTVGGSISRSGDVFKSTDLSTVRFLILDPTKPITKLLPTGSTNTTSGFQLSSSEIPLDLYYLIRIDSKDRDNHIDTLTRMWQEFNPPRTGIPVVVRSKLSAEEKLTADVSAGGSTSITVSDNSNFNLNESVFIFDDLIPTKDGDGGFERPFESKVVGKTSTDTLILEDTVPDTFLIKNNSKIVSNADFRVYMFHFIDHVTKDIEGAQYWISEFMYWAQVWIDRLEDQKVRSAINDIATPIEDLDSNVIIEDL